MMTLDEMKLAVCEKLPELVEIVSYEGTKVCHWLDVLKHSRHGDAINWPTEGLQVCHEAEKLLGDKYIINITRDHFINPQWLVSIWKIGEHNVAVEVLANDLTSAWLEALCRVWWPERF